MVLPVIIKVDPVCPERNREVLVFGVHELKCVITEDTWYKGYVIFVRADPRWELEQQNVNFYKAKLVSNHAIKLTMPAIPFSFALDNQSIIASNFAPSVEESLLSATGSHIADIPQDRFWKNVILEFPDDHFLDITCVDKNKTQVIDESFGEWVTMAPKKYAEKLGEFGSEHWVMFQVALVNTMRELRPEKEFLPYKSNEDE